jgi:uncharacterized protein (TIGR03083 family)
MADLTGHVGTLYRWSSHHVSSGARTRVSAAAIGALPPEGGVVDWVAEGIAPMLATFRTHDPDDRVWGWGGDRHARFWPRRMVFETLVHRVDGELALGQEPSVDPALGVDGIDELLSHLPHATYFAPGLAQLRGDGESVGLIATDVDEAWRIRLLPSGYAWDWSRDDSTATIRGTAGDLLLLVYGRHHVDDAGRFQVSGDAALAGTTLGHMAL